ncbi:hypothetical protein K2173_021147 [Erythroxylum novogranatense]|uniref:Uncharacterized protein n=1 Tax=Erythroxylum novogranatense TaxID=1862640 RepID=A0AAV8TMQ3_9ROSI|nr:hypothetical protein K2173_021147 [Erythroxylum novogranatense]
MGDEELKPRIKKGLWKPEEDLILKTYVETHGEGNWATVSAKSGKYQSHYLQNIAYDMITSYVLPISIAFSLMRGGKSCRLRWKNYLRPNIKRGGMTEEEEDLIIRMHKLLGNRWSLIAGRLPGRTDNEVKNYWNTHLNKRCLHGKRKNMESSNHQKEDSSSSKQRRHCQLGNSNPLLSTDPLSTPKEMDRKKEESSVSETWIEKAQTVNYYIESPINVMNNATFVNDDEPITAYFDSFLWYESLFVGNDVEIHSETGVESVI